MHFRKPAERAKRVREIRLQRRPSLHAAPTPEKPRKIRVLFVCEEGGGRSFAAEEGFKDILAKRGMRDRFETLRGGIEESDEGLAKKCDSADFIVPTALVYYDAASQIKNLFERQRRPLKATILPTISAPEIKISIFAEQNYERLFKRIKEELKKKKIEL